VALEAGDLQFVFVFSLVGFGFHFNMHSQRCYFTALRQLFFRFGASATRAHAVNYSYPGV
jgi:hypothetical protein